MTRRDAFTRAVPALVSAGLCAGAVAVGVGWFARTPDYLHGAGDYLTALGRLTGLLAGYLAVVVVVLMARVPGWETRIGADRLSRWHALGGRGVVLLVAAHGVTAVWGYAIAARVSVVRESEILLRSYPDMVTATVGGVLLLALGGLSLAAARRRLSYESWYLPHLLTYAAVGLAYGHQFADGPDLLYYRPARLAWEALYIGAGLLVLRGRLWRPARQALRHRFTVAEVRPEGEDAVSLVLAGRRLGELAAEPGQFLRVRFLTGTDWWQSHPFSLSAPPGPDSLRITVKQLGDHTRGLSRLTAGTRVAVEGPFGAMTARRRTRSRVLLLAGGMGVAPLRTLFETLPVDGADLTLAYRVRARPEAIFDAELAGIARERGARLVYLSGPSGGPEDPLAPARLAGLVDGLVEHDVYVCGPGEMVRTAAAALRAAGVPRRQVHHESFSLAEPDGEVRRFGAAAAVAATLATVLALGLRSGAPPVTAAARVFGRTPSVASNASDRSRRVTFKGPIQRTLYCYIEIAVTLLRGRVVDVRAVLLPDFDAHSRQLSALAGPILRREALRDPAGPLHVVSGATYTSEAYAQSLQGALDEAESHGLWRPPHRAASPAG